MIFNCTAAQDLCIEWKKTQLAHQTLALGIHFVSLTLSFLLRFREMSSCAHPLYTLPCTQRVPPQSTYAFFSMHLECNLSYWWKKSTLLSPPHQKSETKKGQGRVAIDRVWVTSWPDGSTEICDLYTPSSCFVSNKKNLSWPLRSTGNLQSIYSHSSLALFGFWFLVWRWE